jgi:SH3-like domain-containing protein
VKGPRPAKPYGQDVAGRAPRQQNRVETAITALRASIRLGLGVVLLLAMLAPLPASAQSEGATADSAPRIGPVSGLPLPRFVAMRAPKVNLRTGPGLRYPIDWVYARPGMPLEVMDEFETWRRVRDWEGSIGWVHQNMLSGERRAMVVGKQRLLRREPEETAPGLALVEAGVTGRLSRCESGWCRIEVKGFEGWLREEEIYGVGPGEKFR